MASLRDDEEEFNEEEMWCYYEEEKEDSGPTTQWKTRDSSSSSSAWLLSSASRMVPRVSNTSSAKHETNKMGQQQSSAPLNISDWSKIYGNTDDSGSRVDNGDDDGNGMVLPPHEWLARRLARSRISSSSVCEGIGRTLKGRDLSKVRNAVLTKTGFIE